MYTKQFSKSPFFSLYTKTHSVYYISAKQPVGIPSLFRRDNVSTAGQAITGACEQEKFTFLFSTMKKIKQFIVESFLELHHVTWPTQVQLVRLTGVTIAFVVVSSIVIGALDYLLSIGYTFLLNL